MKLLILLLLIAQECTSGSPDVIRDTIPPATPTGLRLMDDSDSWSDSWWDDVETIRPVTIVGIPRGWVNIVGKPPGYLRWGIVEQFIPYPKWETVNQDSLNSWYGWQNPQLAKGDTVYFLGDAISDLKKDGFYVITPQETIPPFLAKRKQ